LQDPFTEREKMTNTMHKPQTDTEWHAYRAVLSCRLGIQAIEGGRGIPAGSTATEWGIYNLLQAVESLAKIHLPTETK
jgi:hypothetical protein